MIVLRAVDASFARDDLRVEPFAFVLHAGGDVDVAQATARAASTAARMCAAIVKPSTGTIFVGEYETRLQPPEAKRRVGFVDAAGFAGDEHAFRCEVAFRADVWDLDARAAQGRARDVAGERSAATRTRAPSRSRSSPTSRPSCSISRRRAFPNASGDLVPARRHRADARRAGAARRAASRSLAPVAT